MPCSGNIVLTADGLEASYSNIMENLLSNPVSRGSLSLPLECNSDAP